MCGGHHGPGGAPCGCGGHWQHGWGSGHPFAFHRWFSSREEEAAALEQYVKHLESEAKGVRERLAQIRPEAGKAV
jgi:hypothetical protein